MAKSSTAIQKVSDPLPVIDFDKTNLRGGVKFSRVIIHQGSISKRDYGDHPEGTLVDSSTMAPLASNEFITIWPIELYQLYDESGQYVCTTPDFRSIPANAWQWRNTPQGNKPPLAKTLWCWVCVFKDVTHPLVLTFKQGAKGHEPAHQLILQAQRYRSQRAKDANGDGQVPGCPVFKLTAKATSNQKGEWQMPVVAQIGEGDANIEATASVWAQMLTDNPSLMQQQAVNVVADSDSANTPDGNNPPF